MARKTVSGTLKEEINNARANLDSLLQRVRSSKEIGLSLSDEEEDGSPSTDPLNRDRADEMSPRRRGLAYAGKKRKRGAGSQSKPYTASACIVKLFDRSVDLAPYSESSSLYSMCRAWMRNSANEQYIEQPRHHHPPVGESQFPPPYMISDNEPLYELRIPQPIKEEKSFDGKAGAEDGAVLMLKHLAHWKKVRQSWREAGKAYDARFATSHALINQMYESSAK